MNPTTLSRLKGQLDCLKEITGSNTADALGQRSVSGKWSAHENLAHLLRHHVIMIERIQRILSEDAPRLDRYNAETDLEWPRYAALATGDVVDQMLANRSRLIEMVEKLTPEQMRRIGVHTRMGEMPLSSWIEFFLLHEGHHLYLAFLRSRRV